MATSPDVTFGPPGRVERLDPATMADPTLSRARSSAADAASTFADRPGWELVESAAVGVDGPAAHVTVRAGRHEDAIVLIVDDGGYRWITGQRAPISPLIASVSEVSSDTITFDLAINPPPTETLDGVATVSSVRTILNTVVFRFERLAVNALIRLLELPISTGLVLPQLRGHSNGDFTLECPPLHPGTTPWADSDAAGTKRILLLMHGIFVTTRFTFTALAASAEGRELLSRTGNGENDYDAILGFDHRTLSRDPEQNAAELLAALQGLGSGLVIDVVAHSRGSLVTRSLAELITRPQNITIDKVAMVGAPNAGSSIADPDNWWRLLTVFTNLSIAVSRQLSPDDEPSFGAALGEVADPLSAFARIVAQPDVDPELVPGLDAMTPGSRFLDRLNQETTNPHYRFITTNFDADEVTPKGSLVKQAERAALEVSNPVFDGEPNDIAVDQRFMTLVDRTRPPDGSATVFDVPSTTGVHHLSYFANTSVVTRVSQWLSEKRESRRSD